MGRPNDIPRVCVRDLEGYKKTLKVGQEKRIKVLVKRGADWSVWVKAVIIGIYKNIAKVRYRIMTTEGGGISVRGCQRGVCKDCGFAYLGNRRMQ